MDSWQRIIQFSFLETSPLFAKYRCNNLISRCCHGDAAAADDAVCVGGEDNRCIVPICDKCAADVAGGCWVKLTLHVATYTHNS